MKLYEKYMVERSMGWGRGPREKFVDERLVKEAYYDAWNECQTEFEDKIREECNLDPRFTRGLDKLRDNHWYEFTRRNKIDIR